MLDVCLAEPRGVHDERFERLAPLHDFGMQFQFGNADVVLGNNRQRETVVWSPFFRVRRQLVVPRQLGPLVDRTLPTTRIENQRRALTKELGPPVFEDDLILVFRLGPGEFQSED